MSIKDITRNLRKNQTPDEALLWRNLRNRNIEGVKFLRQHPIYISDIQNSKKFYVADFYCAEKKLIVELDGGYHDEVEQKEKDAQRDILIKEKGIHIVRFKNEELDQMSQLLEKIRELLRSL
jgi:leucyl-tRNA synthetase